MNTKNKKADDMNLIERIKAPVPNFFRILRIIGLLLAAAGGAILAAPITLHAAITMLGGYMATAGMVISAVSQVAVKE